MMLASTKTCPECKAPLLPNGECPSAEWIGAYDYMAHGFKRVMLCHWCGATRRLGGPGESASGGKWTRYLPGEHGSRITVGQNDDLVWLCDRCTADNRAIVQGEALAAHRPDWRLGRVGGR